MARTIAHPVLAFRGLLLCAVVGLSLTSVSPAHAGEASRGSCNGDTGVTVVVDASALGGRTTVRCVANAEGMSGLEVLKAAGFDVTGTRRYGDGFVCRIDGRPGPHEKLPIAGNDDYRETCSDTPPADAVWTYWHGEDGTWTFSQQGPGGVEVTPGDVEGWSFALNPKGHGKPPGVAPTSAASAGNGSGESSTSHAVPARTDGGLTGTWVAVAVIVLLGVLGSLTAARRRRARRDAGT